MGTGPNKQPGKPGTTEAAPLVGGRATGVDEAEGKTTAEKSGIDKAAAGKAVAAEKVALEETAAEKAAAEKVAAAGKVAAEKAAGEKSAAAEKAAGTEKAAKRAVPRKMAIEKTALEKGSTLKAAAEKSATDKVAVENVEDDKKAAAGNITAEEASMQEGADATSPMETAPTAAAGPKERPSPMAPRSQTSAPSVGHVLRWTPAEVGAWLSTVGLGQVAEKFVVQDVGGDVLFDVTKGDLHAMGVTIGDQLRFCKAQSVLKDLPATKEKTFASGDRVRYWSETKRQWIPGHVEKVIFSTQGRIVSYNLTCKQHAPPGKIRAG